ncbi:MAG: hypothetical protein J1E62_05940 [Lachnospiraceae bacterium]|nr:hypothetical protein [Lachnospiraceae bacterium]
MVERKHQFQINKLFEIDREYQGEKYLELVLEAEKEISEHKIENDHEIYWKDSKLAINETTDLSFGYGVSGIVYFYIQLYSVKEKEEYLNYIQKGLTFIENHWKEWISQNDVELLPWPDGMKYGLYFGLAGVGAVLTLAYERFADVHVKETLDAVLQFYQENKKPQKKGITWTNSITILTDGGVLLFLLKYYELFPNDNVKDLIIASADWYLEQAVDHGKDGLEFSDYGTAKLSEPDFPYDNVSQPNFELGSAGAGFVLGRLYQVLGDDRYLKAAKGVEIYLDTIKIPQKKGFLLPYRVGEGQEAFYYLGNCHGPAGTAKFYYLLFQITGEEKYLTKLHDLIDGFESLGAPYRMSAGLWNNVSVCCGQGGMLNTFSGLYSSQKDERWLRLAKDSARIVAANIDQLESGNKGWTIAYRRVVPDEFSHTIFYNDGDAGLGNALLQIYLLETGQKNINRFADDPF